MRCIPADYSCEVTNRMFLLLEIMHNYKSAFVKCCQKNVSYFV